MMDTLKMCARGLFMRDQVMEAILREKIIVIVRGVGLEDMEKLVEAISAGGISLVELTFDQTSEKARMETLAGIRMISEKFKGRVIPGAGTVLTKEQVALAREAGAKYIISPNADEEIIRLTRENGLVSIPGCMTPTEIVSSVNAGADFVKLFPAGVLGLEYVKLIAAPLKHVKLLAAGNVTEENAADYLKAGCAGVCVGGRIANREWISKGRYDLIEEISRKNKLAVQI